jgi:hypothetical protein
MLVVFYLDCPTLRLKLDQWIEKHPTREAFAMRDQLAPGKQWGIQAYHQVMREITTHFIPTTTRTSDQLSLNNPDLLLSLDPLTLVGLMGAMGAHGCFTQ